MLLKTFADLKQMECDGNIIIPKKYLKKFIMLTILILKEKQSVDVKDVFQYVNNNIVELPSNWDTLDESKKEKFMETVEELIKVL